MQNIRTIDSLFYEELGKKIRQIREFRNITIKELAQKVGYSRPLVDHWELGRNKIKPKQFAKICKVLNVSNKISIEVKVGE